MFYIAIDILAHCFIAVGVAAVYWNFCILRHKNIANTINNTGFMDEFPYYCILFYGIQSYFVLFLQY